MSIDRTVYVVAGYKMPGKLHHKATGERLNVYEDEYLRYVEGWKDEKFSIIYDGMSGNYTVFGIVLADFGDHDGKEFEEVDLTSINWNEIKRKFIEIFGDFVTADEFGDPKILAINHFS